jgi:hypothetical protein
MSLHPAMEWFERHQALLAWTSAFSILLCVGALLALPVIAARIPRNYFKPEYRSPLSANHPVLAGLIWLGRNLAGLGMMLVGLVLFILPGPGTPVVVAGLLVTTLPARRWLLRTLLRRRPILQAFNRLRQRRGAEPFTLADLTRRHRRRLFSARDRVAVSAASESAASPPQDVGGNATP